MSGHERVQAGELEVGGCSALWLLFTHGLAIRLLKMTGQGLYESGFIKVNGGRIGLQDATDRLRLVATQ